MLLYLLYPLHTYATIFNVTRYITFRTAAASLTALALSLVLGPWMIRKLRDFQIGQVIRLEGPQSHRAKAGTPTMGGLLILTAAVVPTLLWADLSSPYIWIAVLATVGFGIVGFLDDYLKITRRSHHGLIPRYKMLGQIIVALGVGFAVLLLSRENPPLYSTRLIFPQKSNTSSAVSIAKSSGSRGRRWRRLRMIVSASNMASRISGSVRALTANASITRGGLT